MNQRRNATSSSKVTTMTWCKKTASFYLCNSFVKTSSITTIICTHILQ